MAKPLTPPQQAALDKINSQGNTAGIGKGMIAALEKKGYLGGTVQATVPKTEAKPVVADSTGLPNYTGKSWNTLGDLAERIRQDGVEEIQKFDGSKIVTNKRTFGLAFGELTVTVLEQAA